MIAPRCVGCGGTVLELRGECARLDSMHVRAGEPPPIALSPAGLQLSLQFDGPGRADPGGRAFPVYEAEYSLELDDAAAIAALPAGLRGAGAFPVLELAARVGIVPEAVAALVEQRAAN